MSIAAFKLATAGAKKHAAALPQEAVAASAGLDADVTAIEANNIVQEQLKADLKKVTNEQAKLVRAANAKRGKVVRLAEATFGPRAPEMQDFRSKTERKV